MGDERRVEPVVDFLLARVVDDRSSVVPRGNGLERHQDVVVHVANTQDLVHAAGVGVDRSAPHIARLPEVDRVGAIWLRADRTYEMTPVDAGPDTFRVFLYCKAIADFDAREDVVLAALAPPENGATT